MTGSAGQRRVPEYFLADLDIPCRSLPEQRRIAAILDRADALRAKRRAALAQLDTLAQSIFIDMFGDPATNPMPPKGGPFHRLARQLMYRVGFNLAVSARISLSRFRICELPMYIVGSLISVK